MSAGKVYLVGAGPGDPKLLTLRAAELLGQADAVLVDRLVDGRILAHVRLGAEIVGVGKAPGEPCISQRAIEQMLIARARRGQRVVRLKAGDPFVFGRGGEEAQALAAAGVAWEVVPGVSAGIAAPASAGIPLLHRDHASSVAFVSGHASLPARGIGADTVVVFMCGKRLEETAWSFLEAGRGLQTPVAIIESATRPDQRVRFTDLEGLAAQPLEASSPCLLVVGDVCRLPSQLRPATDRLIDSVGVVEAQTAGPI
jgi:uroporphyrin-III C-methyltransferase